MRCMLFSQQKKRIEKHKYLRFFYLKVLSPQVVLHALVICFVICFDIFQSWAISDKEEVKRVET